MPENTGKPPTEYYSEIAKKYHEAAERYTEVVERYEALSDYCGKIVDIMDEHITRWKRENLI